MGDPKDLWSLGLVGGYGGLALWGGLEGRQGGPVPITSLGWWILEGSGCEHLTAGSWKQPETDHLELGIPLWA